MITNRCQLRDVDAVLAVVATAGFSPELCTLMGSLLQVEPPDRPNVYQLLEGSLELLDISRDIENLRKRSHDVSATGKAGTGDAAVEAEIDELNDSRNHDEGVSAASVAEHGRVVPDDTFVAEQTNYPGVAAGVAYEQPIKHTPNG